MVSKSFSPTRTFVSLSIPLILFGVLVIIMASQVLQENDTISLAITLDLILIVPIVYLLLIRKSSIPKTTVVPMMVIGIILGTQFLPETSQSYLNMFKLWFLPVIELGILIFISLKVRRVIKSYRFNQNNSADLLSTVKAACSNILPTKLITPFATEIVIIYYGFFSWKRRKLQDNEFSYHKDSGTIAVLIVFIFLIGIETFSLHILLVGYSKIAAWILTGLSIYTAVQVLGIAKSLSKRPIQINSKGINLYNGLLNEGVIEFQSIESIVLSTKSIEKGDGIKKLSPLGDLEGHNVIINSKSENSLTGIYGFKTKYRSLGLYVDNPQKFKEQVESVLISTTS